MRLAQDGASGLAAANFAITVLGGVTAGWAGLFCARTLLGE
jgi:hypothetical protein